MRSKFSQNENTSDKKQTETSNTLGSTGVRYNLSYKANIIDQSWFPFIVASAILSLGAALALNLINNLPQLIIFGGVFGLFLAFIVFQNPEIGAYVLIFSVFTNMSDLFTEKGLPSVNKPLIAITVLSILVHYLFKTEKRLQFPKITKTEIALLGYFIVISASTLVASDRPLAFSSLADLLKDVIVGVCVLITLNTKPKLKTGVFALILAVAFASFLGVFKTLAGSQQTFWGFAQNSAFGQASDDGLLRYGGPIGESNVWAQVLAATLPLIIYQIVKRSEPLTKFSMLTFALFAFLALLFTQSRGAILALLLIFPIMALEMRIKAPTLLFVATVGLIVLFIVPSKYTERLRTLQIFFQTNQEYGITQDESVAGRREKMLTGLAMFQDNPFLGVGFGNYNTNYWEYAGQLGLESGTTDIQSEKGAREPHSLYVEIMSETGLLGILAFLSFFGFLFADLYSLRKAVLESGQDENWSIWITSISIAILCFLISGFFLHGIRFRYLWVFLGIAFAIINISKQALSSRSSKEVLL